MSHGMARSAGWRMALCLLAAACAAEPLPTPAAEAWPLPPEAAAPHVRFRSKDGVLSPPMPHPAFVNATVALALPSATAGMTADVVVQKEQDGAFAEWLRMAPRIQAGGALQLAGLVDGRYRFFVRCGEADYEAECRAVRGRPQRVLMIPRSAQPLR